MPKTAVDRQKKILIWLLMALVLVVVLAAAYYFTNLAQRPYSAVMLLGGDIYFGHLSYFPRLALTDAYTLQAVANPDDPTQPLTQLVPLSTLSWAPTRIMLNDDNILSISRVSEGSRIAELIKQAAGQ